MAGEDGDGDHEVLLGAQRGRASPTRRGRICPVSSAFFSGLSGHSLPQALPGPGRCEYRRDVLRDSGRTRLLFSVMAAPCGRPGPWFVRVGGGRRQVVRYGQAQKRRPRHAHYLYHGSAVMHDSATRPTATHANNPQHTLKKEEVYEYFVSGSRPPVPGFTQGIVKFGLSPRIGRYRGWCGEGRSGESSRTGVPRGSPDLATAPRTSKRTNRERDAETGALLTRT